jgi:hypothetical protein
MSSGECSFLTTQNFEKQTTFLNSLRNFWGFGFLNSAEIEILKTSLFKLQAPQSRSLQYGQQEGEETCRCSRR